MFVIPAVPYLQVIGLEKDELIQALGLSFTVSTVALALGLLRLDAWQADTVGLAAGARAGAARDVGGPMAARAYRGRTFRKVFFAGLLLLGATLALA